MCLLTYFIGVIFGILCGRELFAKSSKPTTHPDEETVHGTIQTEGKSIQSTTKDGGPTDTTRL